MFPMSSEHKEADCPALSNECGIDGCRKTHSRLLHGTQQTPPDDNNQDEEDAKVNDDEHLCATLTDCTPYTSLPTVPNGTESQVINALINDGFMRTYINNDVAAHLQLLTGDCYKITVGRWVVEVERFRVKMFHLSLRVWLRRLVDQSQLSQL